MIQRGTPGTAVFAGGEAKGSDLIDMEVSERLAAIEVLAGSGRRRDGKSGCVERVHHSGKRAALRDLVAAARLAEQPSSQRGAFLHQFVKNSSKILGGGPLATLERIAKPSFASAGIATSAGPCQRRRPACATARVGCPLSCASREPS